jgi:hypothetical protein
MKMPGMDGLALLKASKISQQGPAFLFQIINVCYQLKVVNHS